MSTLLDMYGVAFALTTSKPDTSSLAKQIEDWIHANKACRHTMLNALSNNLFDVYCSYKEQRKFVILLSSNTLSKMSFDKDLLSENTTAGR